MVERIPHAEGAIEGLERTAAYEESHRRYERIPYRGLLKAFQDRDIRGEGLEVGAGAGALASFLAKDHPDLCVTAVDLSKGMIQRARERVRREGLEKRVPWLYVLPGKNGLSESIRAAYRPRELARLLKEAGIGRFEVGTCLPFFILYALAARDG